MRALWLVVAAAMMTIVRCAIWLVGLRLLYALKRWRGWAFRLATSTTAPLVALLDPETQWRWIDARGTLAGEIHRRHIARLVWWMERRPIDPRRRRAVPSGFATMGQPGDSQ